MGISFHEPLIVTISLNFTQAVSCIVATLPVFNDNYLSPHEIDVHNANNFIQITVVLKFAIYNFVSRYLNFFMIS